jgi:hypothetical protein
MELELVLLQMQHGGPDGLRWCHISDMLHALECRRTYDHEHGDGPGRFVAFVRSRWEVFLRSCGSNHSPQTGRSRPYNMWKDCLIILSRESHEDLDTGRGVS